MTLSELRRIQPFEREKLPIEIRDVVVTAVHCDVRNALVALRHQAAHFVDAQDVDETDKRLSRRPAKEAAECRRCQADQFGDFGLVDLAIEMLANVTMNLLDALPVDLSDVVGDVVIGAGQIAQIVFGFGERSQKSTRLSPMVPRAAECPRRGATDFVRAPRR